MEIRFRSCLHFDFTADLAAADAVANATYANRFTGAGFLPAEARWAWWGPLLHLEVPDNEGER